MISNGVKVSYSCIICYLIIDIHILYMSTFAFMGPNLKVLVVEEYMYKLLEL